jgi:putative ABC transport system ATP-binding protein
MNEPTTGPRGGPVLAVTDLRRTYDPDVAPVRALRGVDLEVLAGEFVAVMGPSGCGKSTLLSLAAGLERPDSGTVELAGIELSVLSDDERAKLRRTHVGIVLQFFGLVDGMSAEENVRLAGLVAGMGRRVAARRAVELLDLLGLLDKADAVPATLSGGQRQRLAIARALVNRPTVLLADEPTGALDTAGGDEIMALFSRLNAEGQTIVMVTHDPAVATSAGRTVMLRDGRVETLAGSDARGER